MIQRPEYLDFLKRWKDKKVIKVISGIRRCGKSTLFELYKEYLESINIKKNQIISLNFEDLKNKHLTDPKTLYKYLLDKTSNKKQYYIFLDEVQHVSNFQSVVDSLYIQKNLDLYLTGSNSHLMSGEISTLLTGRYVELQMLPLSFKEYFSFYKNVDLKALFYQYIRNGSFPYTTELKDNIEIKEYMSGILNTLLLNDVVSRKKIANVPFLKNVLEFLADNIGNLESIKKISDTMSSNNVPCNSNTLGTYIEGLEESLILYKVNRFDIKGKTRLVQTTKHYLSDLGFRYLLLGHTNDIGRILENIVFLELKRRNLEVYVGKINNFEVDFVVKTKNLTYEYYQVCLDINSDETKLRELKSLEQINDNNPKYILTFNNHNDQINGIKVLNALDWLIGRE